MTGFTYIASPYRGEVGRNERYARAAMRDSIRRGEAPVAPHLLYTQPGVLNDGNPVDRKLGMRLARNLVMGSVRIALYTDNGISEGMELERELAQENGIPIEMRTLEHARTLSQLSQDLGDDDLGVKVGLTARQVAERRRGGSAATVDFLYDLFAFDMFPGLDLHDTLMELGRARYAKRKRGAHYLCDRCGDPSIPDPRAPHGYMVTDDLWARVALPHRHLHLACLEHTLGRLLEVSDLRAGAPCNETVVLTGRD